MPEHHPPSPEIPEGFVALLKVEGGEADHHEIRAESLVAVLSGLQRLAYLLAMSESRQELGERLKPSRAMRQQYALRCGIPGPGSYALPLDVGSPDLISGGRDSLGRIQDIWTALSEHDNDALNRLLPVALMQRALREIQKFLPKDPEGLRFSLSTRSSPEPAVLTWRVSRFISERLAPTLSEDAIMTVTGELLRIDFAARQVAILYPPTRREIVCTYLPEIEDSIIESRKEPIQVTGRFVLDEEGSPSKLMDVSRIEPVDFSPMVVTELEALPVRMKTPLVLVPVLDEESQQYLCVADSDLGLDAFALTRDHLFDEVQEQLCMLWREYALASDEELDDAARLLKARLHTRMEESRAEA